MICKTIQRAFVDSVRLILATVLSDSFGGSINGVFAASGMNQTRIIKVN